MLNEIRLDYGISLKCEREKIFFLAFFVEGEIFIGTIDMASPSSGGFKRSINCGTENCAQMLVWSRLIRVRAALHSSGIFTFEFLQKCPQKSLRFCLRRAGLRHKILFLTQIHHSVE